MAIFFATFAALIVLFIIVLRRGPDPRIKASTTAQRLRIAAFVFLAIPLAMFLLFGIGEMVGGDIGGGMHLVEALVVVLLAAIAWRRPFEAGIALCLGGVALAAIFLAALLRDSGREGLMNLPALFILVLPTLTAGILLLSAGILARRTEIKEIS